MSGQSTRLAYPFVAIVGQEEMKLALILNVIDPLIGGVLIMGHRGTGKSTAVRGLAEMLPEIDVVAGCNYQCDPKDKENLCDACLAQSRSRKLRAKPHPVRVVELPLGATEDRVCGSIDIERALRTRAKAFEPGLLARANRGFLYIDEVNLLDDHLVNLLLDAAASGRNRVERESISVEHQARFVLVGSGNPEEGELRPQLQDRFGFYVEVTTDNSVASRIEVVEKREAFDRDAQAFRVRIRSIEERIRNQISLARQRIGDIQIEDTLLRQIAQLCSDLKIDGHRGELTISRAARALAAFEQKKSVSAEDVKRVTAMSLRHRLRRDALEDTASTQRIEEALNNVFAAKDESSQRLEQFDQQINQPDVRRPPLNNRSARKSTPRADQGGTDGDLTLSGPAELVSKLPELQKEKLNKNLSKSSNVLNGTSKSSQAMINKERGSYRRAVQTRTGRIAVDATLRAAACSATRDDFSIDPASLRYKLFTRKTGRLFIFAIDASGSMALKRINQAKGALLQLLKRSYVDRDRVAIVAFRGEKAKVLLPPSRSILRARRVLDSFSIGGGTPLASALDTSLQLVRLEQKKQKCETMLLIFTDGRANVQLKKASGQGTVSQQELIKNEIVLLGADLRKSGIRTVIVETQNQFLPGEDATRLAAILGARHVRVTSER
jgi:magnesium chelatase subunit D